MKTHYILPLFFIFILKTNSMRNLGCIYFTFLLLVFPFSGNFAQCSSVSGDGIHVVQKGETLYVISRKYDCSVNDICDWNGITKNSIIRICQELKVKEYSAASRLDQLTPKSASFESRMPRRNTPSAGQKQLGLKHTVRAGETVAALANMYGYTEERFREFNGLASDEDIFVGQRLTNTECECALSRGNNNEVTNDRPSNAEIEAPNPSSDSNNSGSGNDDSKTSSKAASAYPFMVQTEMDMVNEINLVRSNPAAYVKYIEEYIAKLRKRERYGTAVQSANELIRELKDTPRLSNLEPVECLYEAAKNHGQDRLRAGSSNHKGTDGSWPWDRVKRSCLQMSDGNENLVGGPQDVREAVILLLVDDGISSRGHRRTLLDPKWQHVACYKVGQIGRMPNNWVQKFGY